MSARYPLVRKVSALSTRRGVLARPSRSGSSPRAASSCLIRSCIVLFYMSALPLHAAAQTADALYNDRKNMASAQRALDIWSDELKARPRDFEVAWKLARIT